MTLFRNIFKCDSSTWFYGSRSIESASNFCNIHKSFYKYLQKIKSCILLTEHGAMILPMNSHCFCSILRVLLKQLYQFTLLILRKRHLVSIFEQPTKEILFQHYFLKVFYNKCFENNVLGLFFYLTL